jgi:SAM-dependent methyltransferase
MQSGAIGCGEPMDPKIFKSLARGWEAYGKVDSFFGVLSDRSKLGNRWTAEEFFRTGREHVANLMRLLGENGVAPRRGACLDFGCGIGRLTQPLADHFDTCIGVDVAPSMIAQARRFNRAGPRCRYVLNRAPDLRQFTDASFDLVHSCITLQHLPPDLSAAYIAEFFRIGRPGGLVVFQVPGGRRPEHLSAAAFALPSSGYAAEIVLAGPLPILRAGARADIRLAVTNRGDAIWRSDVPTDEGGHIRVANHWLTSDAATLVNDDGRADLPRTIHPGERFDVTMTITAPRHEGRCLLELDLVQELVCWFGSKGSPTLRVPAEILAGINAGPADAASDATAMGAGAAPAAPIEPQAPRESTPAPQPLEPVLADRASLAASAADVPVTGDPGWFRRLVTRMRRSRAGQPRFEMHALAPAEVRRIVEASGGAVVRAVEDEAAGLHWQSFTYICRVGSGT